MVGALDEADSVAMTTGDVSGSTRCAVAVDISCGINGAGVSPTGALSITSTLSSCRRNLDVMATSAHP